MKSDLPPVAPPAPLAAQRLLDDLRTVHYPVTRSLGRGRIVDVCECCSPAGVPELFPCPTVRIARRHARGI